MTTGGEYHLITQSCLMSGVDCEIVSELLLFKVNYMCDFSNQTITKKN